MAGRGPKPRVAVSAHFDNEGPSARLHEPVTMEQIRNLIDRAERRQLNEFEVARLRSGFDAIQDSERLLREMTSANSRLNARIRVLTGYFQELRSLADFWEEREDRTEVRATIMGVRRYVSMALKKNRNDDE